MEEVGGQHNSARGYMPDAGYWQEGWGEAEGSLWHRMTVPNCPASSKWVVGQAVVVLYYHHCGGIEMDFEEVVEVEEWTSYAAEREETLEEVVEGHIVSRHPL